MCPKKDIGPTRIRFAKFGIQLLFSQLLQDESQVFLFTLWIYQDVINEEDDKFIQAILKYSIHEVHENGLSICQPKWH